MSEIDFKHLGILPNPALLERIMTALNEIDALGNLHLHSAWLYYGSIKAAAKHFDISIALYRNKLQCRVIWLPELKNLCEEDAENIWLGAIAILELPDAERKVACKLHSISRKRFLSRLEQWREPNELCQIVTPCTRLLDSYTRLWKYRNNPNIVFNASGFTTPTRQILKSKSLLENRALDSVVCSVALDIIGEYQTYLWHRERVTQHIKVQRRISDRGRSTFYQELIARDGGQCALCNSKKQLRIDHKKPLRFGGLTEMNNLQFLCFPCNSKKKDTYCE